MPADWTITLVKHHNPAGFRGWNLESPTSGPEADRQDGMQRFRGWAVTTDGPAQIVLIHGGTVVADVTADRLRPDVAQHLEVDPALRPAVTPCGFDLEVPHRTGPWRLEVRTPKARQGSEAVMAFDILDRKAGPYAVIGGGRQLFLGGDSNDSVGQFCEVRSLSEASVRSWTAAFAERRAEIGRGEGAPTAFLVAPAKEEILTEFYPFPRARRTLLDDFRARFAGEGILVPLWELRAQRQFTYSETDTHWTDYGATLAAKTVLKSWDMPEEAIAALPQTFRILQRHGDLGIKLDPPRPSYELMFSDPPDRFLVFDNGVTNQGCLRIWRNPGAPLPGPCAIFGDSFGTNLAQSLSSVFREVVYAYRPASPDAAVMALVRPSHVILEITQRFLHGAPEGRQTLWETARAKIADLSDTERAVLRHRLEEQVAQGFADFAGPLLT